MKLSLPKWDEEEGTTSTAAGAIQVFVIFVILAALIYSEIMFLSIISIAFPPGLIGGLAVVGAVVTGTSCLLLYFGKKHWFVSDSPQFYAAVTFTVVEILIMIGNDVVAFMMMTHQDLGYLFIWKDITPSSPLITIVGWFVVTYLDPGNKIKQKRMKAAQKKKTLEIDHEMTVVEAHYSLQKQQIEQIVERLDDAMSAPSVQRQIEDYANRVVAKVLTQTTGINAFKESKKTIDSSAAPVSLAQATVTEQLVDPQ